jgi:hypothetical protein
MVNSIVILIKFPIEIGLSQLGIVRIVTTNTWFEKEAPKNKKKDQKKPTFKFESWDFFWSLILVI